MGGDREQLTRQTATPETATTGSQRRVIRRAARLTVGAADDPYEREADLVADRVVHALRRSPDDAPFSSTGDPSAPSKIQSNRFGPAEAGAAPAMRSIQRKSSSAPVGASTPIGPMLTESPGTIRRLGVWDWIWGGTKQVGEGMDTGSATMEAVDEGHKAVKGLTESTMLTGGLKTGSDTLGTVGGLVGGSKDLSEGVGSMYGDGMGVGNTMKAVGGLSGLVGGINKGVGTFGDETHQELIKKAIGIGGEELGGWLDFISGGTKVVSGTYLTGKSQLQYNAVKRIKATSRIPAMQQAADKMLGIINERWWMGMWDVGVGTLDMVATSTVPTYMAATKTLGAFSKMVGGDLLWGTLNWATGGKVRTNDIIEDEINVTIAELQQGAVDLAAKSLDGGEAEQFAQLYEQAKVVAPDYAETLSKAIKGLPSKKYNAKKRVLKGRVWN